MGPDADFSSHDLRKMDAKKATLSAENIAISIFLVPVVGIEPTLPWRNKILSLARLPIPPHRQLMEAVTGFEPVVKVLQTSALPLGYTAR